MTFQFWSGSQNDCINKGCVCALKASNRIYIVTDERVDSHGTWEIIYLYDNGDVAEDLHLSLRNDSRGLTTQEKYRHNNEYWQKPLIGKE